MLGRLPLFNTVAYSLVRLNQIQNIGLKFFDVETEYKSFSPSTSMGSSYQFSRSSDVPDLRYFNVTIPTMRFYFHPDGSFNLDYERATNLAWLEWMYNVCKLSKPFLFDHPVHGTLSVRFAEPLQIPKGIEGGHSCVEAITVRLVEIVIRKPFPLGPNWGTHVSLPDNSFEFPYHLISTDYRSEDSLVILGGNYHYAMRGAKPEERMFNLAFKGLKYYLDGNDKIDVSPTPALNMGYLENFYWYYKLDKPFYYLHPVYGRVKVRFKEPLKVPKLAVAANGWTTDFTITLVEVIEDATRYY